MKRLKSIIYSTLLLCLLSTAFLFILPAGATDTLYAHYIINDNIDVYAGNPTWQWAQEFTATETHNLTFIKVKIARQGNPGNRWVKIRDMHWVTYPGTPWYPYNGYWNDGDVINMSQVVDCNTLTLHPTYEWVQFNFTEPYYKLQKNVHYTLELSIDNDTSTTKCGGPDSSNNLHWRMESNNNPEAQYDGGYVHHLSGFGVYREYDMMFETWGEYVAPTNYTLTMSMNEAWGSIEPTSGDHEYEEGTNVLCNATASEGYVFDYWELDTVDVGDAVPYTVTMNANHTMNAVFYELPGNRTLEIQTTIGGSTEPIPYTYVYENGTEVTIYAVPDNNYELNYWAINETSGEPTFYSTASDGHISMDYNVEYLNSSTFYSTSSDGYIWNASSFLYSTCWGASDGSVLNTTDTLYIGQTAGNSLDWYNEDFLFRQTLTIESDYIDSTLTNFPILVYLSSSRIDWSHVQDDLDDIRFVSLDNSTVFKYEIEAYTTNDEAWLWVKIPSISSTLDTSFWMYYDNTEASSGENAEDVWDSNYVMVLHLSETGTGNRTDSTSNHNNAIPEDYDGDENVTGYIDGADDLDGTDDWLNCSTTASFDAVVNVTIELWFNHSSGDNRKLFMFYATQEDRVYLAVYDDGRIIIYNDIDDGGDSANLGAGTFSSGTLAYLTWTVETGDWDVYIDAVIKMVDYDGNNKDFSDLDDGFDVQLGASTHLGAMTSFFDGVFDECRISNMTRSSAWIKASYESGKDSLLSFYGPEVWNVSRTYLYFDTSSLPDDTVIYTATLSFYGETDNSVTDFSIVIQNGQPTYPHDPLETGDYAKGNYTGNGGYFDTIAFSIGEYNSITLTNTSWVNLTGTTKFCLRSSLDIAGTEPTEDEYVSIWSNEKGASFYPRLVVIYTIASNYTASWEADEGTVTNSTDTLFIGQGYNSTIYRGYLFFDTSSLPDDAVIHAAILSFYGATDTSVTDFSITIQNGQPTYPHDPLETGDYAKGNYTGTDAYFDTATFSTSGYNDIVLLNATWSWINLTGTTKFCLRSSRDISGTEPTTDEYVSIWSNEKGAGYYPKLFVNYTGGTREYGSPLVIEMDDDYVVTAYFTYIEAPPPVDVWRLDPWIPHGMRILCFVGPFGVIALLYATIEDMKGALKAFVMIGITIPIFIILWYITDFLYMLT